MSCLPGFNLYQIILMAIIDIKLNMCTIKLRAALGARARACVYSKHVTRLNLVKCGWEQGTEAAIAAHDTRKQEGAIRMVRQHVNQWAKEYLHTEFKCIITDAREDHSRSQMYVYQAIDMVAV